MQLNETVTEKKFLPGGIHEITVQDFWLSTLKASEWVMSIITEGYKIPFMSFPTDYEEPNNTTVVQNLDVVRCLIEDMVVRGILSKAHTEPSVSAPSAW